MIGFAAGRFCFWGVSKLSYPFEIKIHKFKSLQSTCNIPLTNRSTIIIGQNNSGKSNILRGLSSIFNKSYAHFGEGIEFSIKITQYFDIPRIHERIIREIAKENIEIHVDRSGEVTSEFNDAIRSIAQAYEMSSILNSRNGPEYNSKQIYRMIFAGVEEFFNGTVYVPTTRYITKRGSEPQSFAEQPMPGTTLSYGKIIDQLTEIDRPVTALKPTLQKQKKELEKFISYCLEKDEVRIEVPFDQSTIHVSIDGEERPIEQLGTGVEQLIIIGLASFTFPNKLVLIDEPELHFHPRAQKRMIQYLSEEVDANFVIATHSASILDAINADVLQVTYDGKQSEVRTVTNSQGRYQAVRDLGHSPSDLLQTRFAIWVEGPSDRVYLNHWIYKIAPELKEGIDYTILFYGGKILSHHSFLDEDSELVKAVSLARAFAVVMDSDRKPDRPHINKTKTRIREEIKKQGGLCWITEGREIENYIPMTIIEALSTQDGVKKPKTKRDQVLDPEKVKKNDFARQVIAKENDEWPLDLKERVTELVEAIRAAR